VISVPAYTQEKLTDTKYKKDGKPDRITFYNKDSLLWTVTQYDYTGKVNTVFYYDSTGWQLHKSYTTFGENGDVGYILYWNHGVLMGPLYQFYPNGKMRRQGYFYNYYKVGTWQEYYPNGQLRSVENYFITKSDSTDTNYDSNKHKDRADYFKLAYGNFTFDEKTLMDSLAIGKEVDIDDFYGYGKDTYFYLKGLKNGWWYYYDYKGALIRKEHYINNILVK
jgi:antitoxin component YwqK of YwqJK toxin-antitoxin module